MVHYVRFLKPPYFQQAPDLPRQSILRALITITTDLGDAFYPGRLSLRILIVCRLGKIKLGQASWTPGMRCLKTETKVPSEYLESRARLFFTCNDSVETDSLQHGKVPYFVSAWTEEFTGPQDPIADVVVRRFTLLNGQVLDICEDNGESIARHIWDGAIALASWLVDHGDKVQQPESTRYSILELGAGCGMVGLVLALLGSRSHDCRLILTDLDEDSLRLARHNAQKSRQVFNSVCECRTLDWKEPHNFTIDEDLGLIVASECIYNADSIPDLVTTMSDLVRRCRRDSSKGSPGPRVLISTKRRHSSEEMFFDLMSNAGFKQLEHTAIPMCDGYRESTGQDPETVDIHMFEQPAEV